MKVSVIKNAPKHKKVILSGSIGRDAVKMLIARLSRQRFDGINRYLFDLNYIFSLVDAEMKAVIGKIRLNYGLQKD